MMDSYEKVMKEMVDDLPDNKVSKAMKREEDDDSKSRCRLAYRVFDEAISMYKNATLTWDEMMKDISDNLAVIKDMKVPKMEEEDDEEDGESS
jgi:C4-type Zn-finger protein